MSVEEVTDKKIDYLEVDDIIPGQNYVCMSFLSPESLMQDKEAFKCSKFLQSYCKDNKLKFEDVYSQYKDFTYKYEDKLQRDFDGQNNFQTSLRGVKVRGVYDTRQAAEDKAKKLSSSDSSFHVFIGQVGYWLPWDPNADKVDSEHFHNTQLNDMMEKYQENSVNKDMFYEEQKREKIKAARDEVIAANKEKQGSKLDGVSEDAEEYPIDDMEPEPEPESDNMIHMEPEPESDNKIHIEPEPEPESEPERKGSEVSDEIKSSLDGDDPWTQKIQRENA